MNHFGVLGIGELVENIISHLDPHTLTKVIRLNKFFFSAGIQYLWEKTDTTELLKCDADLVRRQCYASVITNVRIWDHEEIWASEDINYPAFPRVQSVEVYGTSLRDSGPPQLVPFLGKALRGLKMWTDDSDSGQSTLNHRDSGWVQYVTQKCVNLTCLKLEVVLDVSPADLAALFEAMPQLQVLRVGRELNPMLNTEAVSAILVLPKLERLSMDLPLNEFFVQDFVGSRSPASILPSITHLDVAFLNGHSHATATLLDAMPTLKFLTLTLRPTNGEEATMLDPAFFSIVVVLPHIVSVDLLLGASTMFPCADLAAMAARLNYLNISCVKEDFITGQGHIHVTEHDLLIAHIGFNFLEALTSLNMTSSLNTSYEEVTIIAHRIMAVDPRYIKLFDFSASDATSPTWPGPADYELLRMQDMIWKPSNRSFAPDPTCWAQRDLDEFTDKHGDAIPLNEVVSGGSFNHLTSK